MKSPHEGRLMCDTIKADRKRKLLNSKLGSSPLRALRTNPLAFAFVFPPPQGQL